MILQSAPVNGLDVNSTEPDMRWDSEPNAA